MSFSDIRRRITELLHADISLKARDRSATEINPSESLSDVTESGEVVPPWVKYKGSEPWMGIWRQGGHEEWFLDRWRPYMNGLSREEEDAYYDRWAAPEDWRLWMIYGRERQENW